MVCVIARIKVYFQSRRLLSDLLPSDAASRLPPFPCFPTRTIDQLIKSGLEICTKYWTETKKKKFLFSFYTINSRRLNCLIWRLTVIYHRIMVSSSHSFSFTYPAPVDPALSFSLSFGSCSIETRNFGNNQLSEHERVVVVVVPCLAIT